MRLWKKFYSLWDEKGCLFTVTLSLPCVLSTFIFVYKTYLKQYIVLFIIYINEPTHNFYKGRIVRIILYFFSKGELKYTQFSIVIWREKRILHAWLLHTGFILTLTSYSYQSISTFLHFLLKWMSEYLTGY